MSVYFMSSDPPPGKWKAPGMPDLIPNTSPPPPPPPPPGGLLRFGTTMFGQSYSRYKEPTLSATGGTRYNGVENDTAATIGGTLYKGGGVTRVYGNGIGVWSDAHPAYMRADHPVIYSFKPNRGVTQATFKSDMRAFLDSKGATTTAFCWLLPWHEPDNDWNTDASLFTEWCNWLAWGRQVLNEGAYSSRTDVRWGWITTGGPWGQNQNPDATTGTKGWRAIKAGIDAAYGGPGCVDFQGMDRYNPGWNGTARYMTYANWAFRAQQGFAETGLPMVIGECGTPRADTFPSGWTIAQRDTERATYWRSMCDGMLTDGFYDAAAWWRVPAVKNNPAYVSKIANPFSTVMITPTGYNATLVAAGETPPPGGTDAQAVVDVHGEYAVKSLLAAGLSFQP